MQLRTMINLKPNEKFYAWRRVNNWSQARVAEDYGFHQTAISKMEGAALPINSLLADASKNLNKVEIPDWVFLSIARRRLKLKIADIAVSLDLPLHYIGDMESGKMRAGVYAEFLKRRLRK